MDFDFNSLLTGGFGLVTGIGFAAGLIVRKIKAIRTAIKENKEALETIFFLYGKYKKELEEGQARSDINKLKKEIREALLANAKVAELFRVKAVANIANELANKLL